MEEKEKLEQLKNLKEWEDWQVDFMITRIEIALKEQAKEIFEDIDSSGIIDRYNWSLFQELKKRWLK